MNELHCLQCNWVKTKIHSLWMNTLALKMINSDGKTTRKCASLKTNQQLTTNMKILKPELINAIIGYLLKEWMFQQRAIILLDRTFRILNIRCRQNFVLTNDKKALTVHKYRMSFEYSIFKKLLISNIIKRLI